MHFLNSPQNISFLLNTDGVSVFKSSNVSLWPVYMQINELPYHKRKLKENTILCGLWVGEEKPNFLNFFKPITSSLIELYTNGVEVESPDIQQSFVCKALLLTSTFDLPAKASALNMTQYNGEYGCTKCLQSGERMKTSRGGSVRVFPFQENNPTGPPRVHAGIVSDSKIACRQGAPSHGVKGPCYLAAIPGFDMVRGTVVDYMHCVLLGVTRMLLALWFGSENHDKMWYCGHQVSLCDDRLTSIRPPNYITRCP